MQRKYLLLIIGMISGVAVVGSLVGGSYFSRATQMNTTIIPMYSLSLTPVSVVIEVISTQTWEGNWTIGDKGGSPSGVPGTFLFNGTISGTERAIGHFAFNNLAGGSITVNIYLNGELKQSDTTTTFMEAVVVNQDSPLSFFGTFAVALALEWVLSNPLELI